METKEYRTVDKSNWPRGEWDAEPDKVQWQDKATGLPCLIVRGPSGALCGYVGVSEGHRLFEVGYDDARRIPPEGEDDEWFDVHAGLTFSDFCSDSPDESRHICHVPAEGEPDRVWWFGFDCAHSGDHCPKHAAESSFWEGGTYRHLGYVRRHVESLATQLARG